MKPLLPTDLIVKRSYAGLGLFTKVPISKGTKIIEYVGDVISNDEADRRGGKYLFEVSKSKTIDGKNRKNKARYINHSHKPNCWAEIRQGRVWIVAKRAIKPGEELTYNYGKWYVKDIIEPHGCRCEKCRAR
jgi:SET domain-containing protein